MCGIIGYIGNREAAPLMIEGLKRLEYRGYDSAGFTKIKKINYLKQEKKKKLESLTNKYKGK